MSNDINELDEYFKNHPHNENDFPKRKMIEFECCTQYWVLIPTITWHRKIGEFELLFLCFNLIFIYNR
jgi:hypothetical protein